VTRSRFGRPFLQAAPTLLLARIDGNSPAEYITQEIDRAFVRPAMLPLFDKPPSRLRQVRAAFAAAPGCRK